MTPDELRAVFDKHQNEYLKFGRITARRSQRPDIHAFLLLDELVTPELTRGIPDRSHDMVSAAEHDQIYLVTDPQKLAEAATVEQVVELIRCGVMYDSDTSSLSMFV